ncbi:MAG TPA: T9SS type A sorting domain-containing protein [Flavisolibacter sp.]
MKQKILLFLAFTPFAFAAQAQKKQKTNTAYVITAVQKGQSAWTEVRLVDVTTGEELKTVYQSSQEVEALNARTGKPIVKKDATATQQPVQRVVIDRAEPPKELQNGQPAQATRRVVMVKSGSRVQSDKPFATNSAACAYDRKHDRLYYTPLGINQLRYIDLKAKSPKVYYFEDEPFGALAGPRDVPNQITRMVIASDGNGYALTNNGEHLIRFTTGKKPEITDLGPVADDGSNGTASVRNQNSYGGDMIADNKNNLYLITANRAVFRISIDSRVATYLGHIKGLPKGYSTNGAIAAGGSSIIVSSSGSTQGYYKFDLNTLQAEKVSSQADVFNASDMANGALVDRKKDDPTPEEVKPEETVAQGADRQAPREDIVEKAAVISVYPNPVTNGLMKLSFENQPAGRYQVQLMDISGKVLKTQEVNINNKVQVEEFSLPKLVAAGNYLVKIQNQASKVSVTNKIVVQ